MASERQEEALLRVAAAIADGEAVDWEQETSGDSGLAPRLRHLRLIESLGQAHADVRRERRSETRTADLPRGPRAWGKLRLVEKLDGGAHGEVYRAWDPDLDREVALKLPVVDLGGNPAFEERFLREARQLARVRHPNVLTVYGAEKHDGRVGLWAELLEGRTLEARLRGEGRSSADEAIAVGLDLCRALAAVHGAGLVHRDVKTSNVVREEGGRTVLLDFSAAAERLPATGAVGELESLSGTPLYMAPEIFRGRPASVQSDLYSVGVVLYRLVSLRYPTEAASLEDLVSGRADSTFTPLRDCRADLPGPFVRVVETALSADPQRRYRSAGEMEAALEAVRSGQVKPVSDPVPGPAPDPLPTPWFGGARWAWALLAGAVVVAAALIGPRLVPPRLEVEATFFAGDPARALAERDTLSVGDDVGLELETSKAAWVYVLNEDQAGHRYALFPLEGSQLSNPLAAGTRHELPGMPDGVLWRVSVAGGAETFVVIVSLEPLPAIEDVLERLPQAGEGAVEIDDEILLRGVGGLGRPREKGGPSVSDLLVELAAGKDDLWVRSYTFLPPAPSVED